MKRKRPQRGRSRRHPRQRIRPESTTGIGEVQVHRLTREALAERLPGLEAAVQRVRARLLGDDCVVWCGHRDPRQVVACGQHPAAGLHCIDCIAQHVARHSWTAEHECGVCGKTSTNICGYVERLVGLIPVYDRRGRRSLVVGEITVGGLVACRRCLDRAGVAA